MHYRPDRVLLLGIATYLVIFIIAPVTPIISLQFSAIAFIFLCCVSFATGNWTARLASMRGYREAHSEG